MAENPVQRRLAAILAADVVGYSRLVGQDEDGTLAAIRKLRAEVIEPRIAEHQGRLFKTTGDGFLAEFASVVNAVACAAAIQKAMAARNADQSEDRRLQLRIGVHLGDVISEGGDVYGDGVNVAARIEGLAPPGGVAVSAMVHDNVGSRLDLAFEDMGEQQLKNIAKPLRVYRLSAATRPAAPAGAVERTKPSIAVLPFTNMSGDAEQEYFVDGLTEDIITDLSNAQGILVIARNSSFSYKGKATDVRQIARDLGVKYILEGSVRRVAQKLRVNVQLIDAAGDGTHLFAERFDREMADIFAVQDEVTSRVVESITGRIGVGLPVGRYRTSNLEAYDLCVRARPLWVQSRGSAAEARSLLARAISLDPNYAEAYWRLALAQLFGWLHWGEDKTPLRTDAIASSTRAVEFDPSDSSARWVLGYVLLHERQWEQALSQFATSVSLNPNDADAAAMYSDILVLSGRPQEGVASVERALKLNPFPPSWYFSLLGQALVGVARYEEAIRTLKREETYRSVSRRHLAAALAIVGRHEEAREEAHYFIMANPHWRISAWSDTQAFQNTADRQFWIDAYRMAGLPE